MVVRLGKEQPTFRRKWERRRIFGIISDLANGFSKWSINLGMGQAYHRRRKEVTRLGMGSILDHGEQYIVTA